ncbi:Glycosyl transferase family 2 [Prosthecobacter debontii]|uniref:Glycosyl transferase family 2 n=1 Tax=Prosthecobacter debontii TaxID=48467 RepID=A0A1T4YD14_9BACT|nr:glycosyltransferase family 2 protein [Prosthecobacter debontii]SKA99717.1 Glycosyl transferase family 2 [Prosthecobacter debontii]
MPLISIVIPTFNRAQALQACLESLYALDAVPGGFEIIVVDDGSQDTTRQVCQAWPQIRYEWQANQGVARARNRGVELAQGEWIAFIDDDCQARQGWLTALWKACGGDESVMAASPLINALKQNPFAEASQSLLDYVYSCYNTEAESAHFVAGANFMVSKKRFLTLGGSDGRYAGAGAEDRDFCARWLEANGRIVCLAEAKVEHSHHMGLREFCRQHYSYGLGAWRFHQQAPVGKGGRGMRTPGYYWNMLTHPMQKPGGWERLRLTGLIVLSQVMSTLGYARATLQTPRS